MKKLLLIATAIAFAFCNCTDQESPCGENETEITDANGVVIDCIEIPETPSFPN